MDTIITRLVEETDFVGYVIVDWDGYFGKTKCPNEMAAMCLERSRTGGSELSQFIKSLRIGTMGEYHHTPGERFVEETDWNKSLKELFA